MTRTNPFLRKTTNPTDLQGDFSEVWDYFKDLNKEPYSEVGVDLHGLVFDKIYSSVANCWLIYCHAQRLTDTTIVLAHLRVREDLVEFKTPNEDEWTVLRNSDAFVDKLFELIDDPMNKRQFFIMQQENDKKFFMGYFCAEEPYEIDYRSVKFVVTAEQCDLLLAQKDKKLEELEEVSAQIINNIYPQTSTFISNDVSQYKFITFNGFLYTPIEITPGKDGLFSFKAQFIRDMKM